MLKQIFFLFLKHAGQPSIVNPSFGNLERKVTDIFDMLQDKSMPSQRILLHTYLTISKWLSMCSWIIKIWENMFYQGKWLLSKHIYITFDLMFYFAGQFCTSMQMKMWRWGHGSSGLRLSISMMVISVVVLQVISYIYFCMLQKLVNNVFLM